MDESLLGSTTTSADQALDRLLRGCAQAVRLLGESTDAGESTRRALAEGQPAPMPVAAESSAARDAEIRALDSAAAERRALEERIAELTEVNAATDRALQRLADGATPEGFVRNLQREMIELLGGRCSAQFKIDGNSLSGGIVFADGVFVSNEASVGVRDSDVPSWNKIMSNPRPTVLTLADEPCLIHELTVTFMKERGFHWLINFPLFVSGRPAWLLAVLGDNAVKLTDANLDRFAALGRQLTLALQLNHMHDEAAKNERARAVAEERAAMARDIHDTLAQGFAAVCMRLQAAQREAGFGDTPQAVRNQIAASLEISSSHLIHARRSIHCLRADSAEHFRLDQALHLTITQIGMDIPLTSRVQFPAAAVPNAVGLELLRIAQEALTNAAKHSGASRVTLKVSPAEGGGIMIAVGDNGKGFDQERRSEGFGLVGMQERASRVRAQLTIASEPGAGTEVVVVWIPEARTGGGQ